MALPTLSTLFWNHIYIYKWRTEYATRPGISESATGGGRTLKEAPTQSLPKSTGNTERLGCPTATTCAPAAFGSDPASPAAQLAVQRHIDDALEQIVRIGSAYMRHQSLCYSGSSARSKEIIRNQADPAQISLIVGPRGRRVAAPGTGGGPSVLHDTLREKINGDTLPVTGYTRCAPQTTSSRTSRHLRGFTYIYIHARCRKMGG